MGSERMTWEAPGVDEELTHTEIAGKLAAALARAWNSHDMEALASFFHDDAALVNAAAKVPN